MEDEVEGLWGLTWGEERCDTVPWIQHELGNNEHRQLPLLPGAEKRTGRP